MMLEESLEASRKLASELEIKSRLPKFQARVLASWKNSGMAIDTTITCTYTYIIMYHVLIELYCLPFKEIWKRASQQYYNKYTEKNNCIIFSGKYDIISQNSF